MDCISHSRIAKLIANHVDEFHGLKLDLNSFVFGNLKPDLKAEYITKRHNPSVMFDEVMEKIVTLYNNYEYSQINENDYSVDLGEICHYLTDFVSYPHNDDIYDKSLLSHYIYEKRLMLNIFTMINRNKLKKLTENMRLVYSLDELIHHIKQIHREYIENTKKHSMKNDLEFTGLLCSTFVVGMTAIIFDKQVAVSATA